MPSENPNETLGPGDFFGVVSAMSRYPQIESAIAMTRVVLLSISNNQFIQLMKKSNPAAIKMIRYFTMKLRLFGNAVEASQGIIHDQENTIDSKKLFKIAEAYYRNGSTEASIYCYKSYMKYFPNEPKVSFIKDLLMSLGKSLDFLPQEGSMRSYRKDEMIFVEGEPGSELFIVQKGNIKITQFANDQEIILNIMKTNDIFGEMSLLDNQPRSASAVALDDVEILAISKKSFDDMIEKQPHIMSRIITHLSERIWNAYMLLSNTLIPDMQGRIADILLMIAIKNRVQSGPMTAFSFNESPSDLLKILGLSSKDMNAIDKYLALTSYVKLEGNRFVCTDLDLLERNVFLHREALRSRREKEEKEKAQVKIT